MEARRATNQTGITQVRRKGRHLGSCPKTTHKDNDKLRCGAVETIIIKIFLIIIEWFHLAAPSGGFWNNRSITLSPQYSLYVEKTQTFHMNNHSTFKKRFGNDDVFYI